MDYTKHFKEIDELGYTLIPNILTGDKCARMAARLDDCYARRQAAGLDRHPSVSPEQEKIVFNLHNKDDMFLEFIDHPAVMPILERDLDNTLILNYFNGRSPVRGCKPQHLHLDSRVPFPTTLIMMQAIWMINDFTVENGATRVVPGSHRFNAKPDRSAVHPAERQITGKAGSVFLYNSSLWHGASACAVPGSRWGIIATYSRWFVKPSMDFTRNTPPDLYVRLSSRQKQMLGFNSVPPHDEAERISTLTPPESLPEQLSLTASPVR